jgi:rhodanese-related sulfurtransferase
MNPAIEFFEQRLRWQTDPADLATARMSGAFTGLVIDVRNTAAWAQGRIPGAVHIPAGELPERVGVLAHDLATPLVVYCWGPGCNGSTKAALVLAKLGYRDVRELVGGFEYWAREGFAIEAGAGRYRREVDDLTAPRRITADPCERV